ncbi:puratrophin-1 isoform 1-T3 [Aulostomus maculatus]
MAWLDTVNGEREERGVSKLDRCLLSTQGDVFRVPWEDLVYPQFISRSRTALKEDMEHKSTIKEREMFIHTSHESCRDSDLKPLPPSTKSDQSAVSSEGDESEGEYVELAELPLPLFSPQRGSLTQSISLQHRHTHSASAAHSPEPPHTHTWTRGHSRLRHDSFGRVVLTPVSSAPTDGEGTSRLSEEEEELTEGTGSIVSLSLNTQLENCTEQREEEEETEKAGEVKRREDKVQQEAETGYRRDDNTLDGKEMEEESEETVGYEGGEFEEERTEDVEEVRVIMMEQSQASREDEDEGDERVIGGGGIDEEERVGRMYKKMDSHSNTLTEDFYSENHTKHTQAENSYSENKDPNTVSEGSISVNVSKAVMEPGSVRNKYQESGWAEEEEEDQVGGGKTGELQTEGGHLETSSLSVIITSSGRCPTEPEQLTDSSGPYQSAAITVPTRLSLSSQSRFSRVLLVSGALCLPGTRDRSGRALLTICTRNTVWSNPDCVSSEVLRLFRYYSSTLREDVQALGLTVLVDARSADPVPALFSALQSLQEDVPGSIHSLLLLVNKNALLHVDKAAALQVQRLVSLKCLQKHVALHQLPAEFGGSFTFNQRRWISWRSRVEQLSTQCEDVINLLQTTINILKSTPLPTTAKEAEQLLSRYEAMMRSILEDSRLVQLQQEGGAMLVGLCREEGNVSMTVDYRAAVQVASKLYNQVDELLHHLVALSNTRTKELQFIVEFNSLERGFAEVKSWLLEVGDVRLKILEEADDSLELLDKKQQDFMEFCTSAYERCKDGEELLSRLERWSDMLSPDLRHYEVKVHSFWVQLQDFSQRVNAAGHNIDQAVQLYRFLDQAYGWALDGLRHLADITMEDCMLPDKCQAVIGCLEDYQRKHPPIPEALFLEMKAAACELRGERGLHQWSFAWSKCQETQKVFDRKLEAALRTRDSGCRERSNSTKRRSSTSRRTLSGLWGVRDTSSPLEVDTKPSSPLTSRHRPLLRHLFRSASSSEDASAQMDMCSSSPSLPHLDSSTSSNIPTSSSLSRRQQLRKTQSFDCPSTPEASRYGPCPRPLSEPARRGNTGVFIHGLEISSTEAASHTLCSRTAGRSPGTLRTPRTSIADLWPQGCKLHHIVEEMVTTEREYVRSLHYIIHYYFPEMERADLPQDLRGKRSVVFGNLEKLLDFHRQFFLRELEACWRHPLRVAHCFLRHQEQFALYALYSKNKPKSDALLANHGLTFFRRKQLELGDKMDLSSYLLKPIQRMTKYALLLTDIMKEVGGAQDAELVTLQAATNMVKFQLRHGNDLLAMDAIRECDVNLKEQGQLLRQDEFSVWSGRRKCLRHVFLFEDLVLFSKPKRVEGGGLDVYIYKHSFKTADVGLTESTGDDGLRFEIWFRRRTTKNQTFILQAATVDVKRSWTTDIARILWTQAARNKEMRLREMVSMGVGNKPFLDIQPSAAAISDRAVHCIMKGRGARTRASIAVSVFDHSSPFRGGAVTPDPISSGPSSCSLLGPLNLHMYSQTPPPLSCPTVPSSFITSCVDEDEQETSSQPSITTESSGSSSRCLSGSTGSDSGCISSNLQEVSPEDTNASDSSPNIQQASSHHISAKVAAIIISPATAV